MPKFKMTLKLTGLELSVEGSREDVASLTQAAGQQFSSMLAPVAGAIEAEIVQDHVPIHQTPQLAAPEEAKKRAKRPRQASKTPSSSDPASSAIDWRHDPSKWGAPQQSWSTADRCMWLLWVVRHEKDMKEMSGAQLAATFNKHFREAKPIRSQNIARDLGKAKKAAPSLVGSDTTKTPAMWFLTQEGEKKAQELVAKGKGESGEAKS